MSGKIASVLSQQYEYLVDSHHPNGDSDSSDGPFSAQAAEALQDENLQLLFLCNSGKRDTHTEELAKAINNHRRLLALELDKIHPRDMGQLFTKINGCRVRYLSICHIEGAEPPSTCEKNKTVKHLSLTNAPGLVHHLVLNVFQAVTHLYLANNEINDERISELTGLSHLIELDLNENKITDVGAKALRDVLQGCLCLEKLNLSNNSIGDSGAQTIAAVTSFQTLLNSVDLRDNPMSNSGAVAVALLSLNHSNPISTKVPVSNYPDWRERVKQHTAFAAEAEGTITLLPRAQTDPDNLPPESIICCHQNGPPVYLEINRVPTSLLLSRTENVSVNEIQNSKGIRLHNPSKEQLADFSAANKGSLKTLVVLQPGEITPETLSELPITETLEKLSLIG